MSGFLRRTGTTGPRASRGGGGFWLAGVMVAAISLFTLSPNLVEAAPPPPAQEASTLRFIHGLRGVVAQISLDGVVILQNFQPERSTDPLPVAPGNHTVALWFDGTPMTQAPQLSETLEVTTGQLWSIVVHLSSDGQPQLSNFFDDATPVNAGQTRVVVRHTAAAPAIDVALGDDSIATDLANPDEAVGVLAAGTYQVSVTATGTPQALAPLQEVPLQEGTLNDMYLIGSEANGTLGWIAVRTASLESSPTKVQTGDSGLAHGRSDLSGNKLSLWMVAGTGISAAFVVIIGISNRRRRIQV